MRQLVRATGQILSAGIVGYGLAAIYSVLVARYLGPTGKGTVALLMLIPAFGIVLLSSGLEIANTYFVGRSRHQLQRAAGNSLLYAAVIGTAGAACLWALRSQIDRTLFQAAMPQQAFLLAVILLPLAMTRDFLYSLLLGLRAFAAAALCKTVRELCVVVLLCLVFALWAATPLTVLIAAFGGVLATIVVCALLLRPRLGSLPARANLLVLPSYLALGIKGQIGRIAERINYRLDRFLIAFFLGRRQVGYYSVAVGLAEVFLLIPMATAEVLFPTTAHQPASRSQVVTPLALKYTVLLSACGVIALAASGRWLIPTVFGGEFLPAVAPMLWLLPGVVTAGIGQVLTGDLNGRGLPQYGTFAALVALVFTVGLDLTLIPLLGINGAAIASSVAYTAGAIVVVVCFVRVRRTVGRQLETDFPGVTDAADGRIG